MDLTSDKNDYELLIDDIQAGRILPIAEKRLIVSDEVLIWGSPTYLVRFAGCNLKCPDCPIGDTTVLTETLTPEQLLIDIENVVKNYPNIKVLFTGGESLMFHHNFIFNYIAGKINYTDFFVKSNGTIKIEDIFASNIHYILECKTPSSCYADSFIMDNLKMLRLELDAVRFHANEADLPYISDKIAKIYKIKPFIDIFITAYMDLTQQKLADFILTNKLTAKIH